jgi:hypothetical protein
MRHPSNLIHVLQIVNVVTNQGFEEGGWKV